MRGFCVTGGLIAILLGAFTSALLGQQGTPAVLRAPATPLVVHDPYFSIWSASDRLTDGPTRHWTGVPHALNGIVRVDGKNYRYLGDADRNIPALEESHREITPTRTVVYLKSAEIELTHTFLTPAFPDDLKIMARPITYFTWDVVSRDGAQHNVSIYLDVDSCIATDRSDQEVVWSRAEIEGLHLLRVGTSKQEMLTKNGDDLRIDWGYFYLAVPAAGGASELVAGNQTYRDKFAEEGKMPAGDDLDQPRMPQSRYPAGPALNLLMNLGSVGEKAVTRHAILGYDDVYSVEYMHQKLLPYWRTEFSSFGELLKGAERDYLPLKSRAEKYDAELEHDLTTAGGAEYAAVATLAFRQTIGAHKLVEDCSCC